MNPERFVGPSVSALMKMARSRLGPDAVLLSVDRKPGRTGSFELLAMAPEGARPATRTEWRVAAPLSEVVAEPRLGRPFVLALVGPPGSGKTTTLGKLVNHPSVFIEHDVALFTLDTHRAGTIEQMRIFARLSGVPLVVISSLAQIDRAMRRHRHREVILVDTPGRSSAQTEDSTLVREQLIRLRPDEVHLTLPAGFREQWGRRAIVRYRYFGITHILPTKTDEGADETPFQLAAEYGLPIRWWTNGQHVPRDLQVAQPASGTAAVRMTERMADQADLSSLTKN